MSARDIGAERSCVRWSAYQNLCFPFRLIAGRIKGLRDDFMVAFGETSGAQFKLVTGVHHLQRVCCHPARILPG